MRDVSCNAIIESVKKLCIEACCIVTKDMYDAFMESKAKEQSVLGRDILGKIIENADIAKKEMMPICQDTGMTVVFVELGQEVHIIDGYLEDAINEGVAKGYTEGYLRKSVVKDPIYHRDNTKNNTPAVIHVRIVPGNKLKIKVAPKGFGSENKGILKMLVPADGLEGVKRVFLEAVENAGPNACPPLVVGVGVGGTMEKCAILAKEAAIRSVDSKNPNPEYARLEEELRELANKTGVGPQGLGGNTTAIKVNIEVYPTHIAGLPVCININCHAARHAEIEL
ncbi:MAG: fumarate hydratase [Helicobacter sp.]|nr:fumarate hydratase [Helicobacter sp.]